MTIQIPYRWARGFGLKPAEAYRIARLMRLRGCSFTDAMIAGGVWVSYRVWA